MTVAAVAETADFAVALPLHPAALEVVAALLEGASVEEQIAGPAGSALAAVEAALLEAVTAGAWRRAVAFAGDVLAMRAVLGCARALVHSLGDEALDLAKGEAVVVTQEAPREGDLILHAG